MYKFIGGFAAIWLTVAIFRILDPTRVYDFWPYIILVVSSAALGVVFGAIADRK
ncbi:MAG: hypothetical protein Q7R45_08280 [Sulfuricaulis sp.]|nr:hypothetical protein [Sulfuricaulis sp.]